MRIVKYLATALILLVSGWLLSLPSDISVIPSDVNTPEFKDYDFRSEAIKLWDEGQPENALALLETAIDFQTSDSVALQEQHNEYLQILAERNSPMGKLKAFGFSFVTGEVNSFEELAGSSVADFFMYGDIRDLTRELIFEDHVDPFIASLSAAGLLTSLFPPADATVSILKSAKKSDALTGPLQQQMAKLLQPMVKSSKQLSPLDLKQTVETLRPFYTLATTCKTWKQFTLYLKNCENLKQVKFLNKVLSKSGNPQKLSSILIVLNNSPDFSKKSLAYIRNYGQKGMDLLYKATRKGPKALQFLLKNPGRTFKLSKNSVKAHNLFYSQLESKWQHLKSKHGLIMEAVRYALLCALFSLIYFLFRPQNKVRQENSKSTKLNAALLIGGIVLGILLVKQNLSGDSTVSSELTQNTSQPNGSLTLSSMLLLIIFAAAQIWAFLKVKKELFEINQENRSSLKSKMLDNAEFFFDLPIYLGLSGTVFSFILLTLDPSGSRIIAYGSTITGILLSIYMRGFMLMPLKKELLKESE